MTKCLMKKKKKSGVGAAVSKSQGKRRGKKKVCVHSPAFSAILNYLPSALYHVWFAAHCLLKIFRNAS